MIESEKGRRRVFWLLGVGAVSGFVAFGIAGWYWAEFFRAAIASRSFWDLAAALVCSLITLVVFGMCIYAFVLSFWPSGNQKP